MLYEGGVKGVALVTGKMRKHLRGSENSGWVPGSKYPLSLTTLFLYRLMYVTDWFSTFLDLAGLKQRIPDAVDSFSMWRTWSGLTPSPRADIVLNIDRSKVDKFISSRWLCMILKQQFLPWSGLTLSNPGLVKFYNAFRDKEKGLWSAALRKGKFKLIWGQSKLLKQEVFKKTS